MTLRVVTCHCPRSVRKIVGCLENRGPFPEGLCFRAARMNNDFIACNMVPDLDILMKTCLYDRIYHKGGFLNVMEVMRYDAFILQKQTCSHYRSYRF